MNNDQPPAPDPFEQIAQQLATLAAGMIQIAGQIAKLKDAQQQPTTPPPAPQPEPEPEPEEQGKTPPEPEDEPESEQDDPPEKDEPKNDDKASDDQPTHEDGQGGEKDVPQDNDEAAQDEPQGEPEQSDESNATEDAEPAESSADEPQPDADDLSESEQDGEGEELDNQPDAPAEEQPAEPEGEDGDESSGDQSQGEGQPADDATPTEGTPTDAAPEGDNSDGELEAEAEEQGEADEDEDEDGEIEPTDEPATEEEAEAEPSYDEGERSPEGDGDNGELADEEGDDGSKGTAAQLPPDLPPLDSSLANCAPPPAPESVPYRPLSPVARKVADILTAALGKRFALPRPNRHTGNLSGAAVARHAPDPFSRRPRQDGKRPKLTVLVDTSGSMTTVRRLYGIDLIDGLLEAHRRRVIDLRIYDAFSAKYKQGTNEYTAEGMLDESRVKAIQSRRASYGETLTREGVLRCVGGEEGFAGALQNLIPVIKDSDATILFTDGHWTDGALDKNEYTRMGIEVVGLYIQPAANAVSATLAAAEKAIEAMPSESHRHAYAKALQKYRDSLPLLYHAATTYFSANMRLEVAAVSGLKMDAEQRKTMIAEIDKSAVEHDILHRAALTEWPAIHGAITSRAGTPAQIDVAREFNEAVKSGGRMPPHDLINASASSKAQLEMNSHRSYATPDALTAAQAILQEITMQIANH